MDTTEKPYYTPEELHRSGQLPCGITAIYKHLRAGTIPSIRVGRKFMIPKAALQKWLETCGGATALQ
ncbi:MAG: excisionase family DNA-binding protein [Bryobacterales bacterium]|nr:excisionase family DNA-binding protein [Bryobacterales bacterium]